MKILLGLGSNLGDRLDFVTQALAQINAEIALVERCSRLYETEPLTDSSQKAASSVPRLFLNCVALCDTRLPPEEILKRVKAIEKRLGRRKRANWGAREIDIDILAIENLSVATPNLTIPHAEMHRRDFVLIPLEEIYPDFRHPVFGTTVGEMLGNLKQRFVTCKSFAVPDFDSAQIAARKAP